MKLDVEKIKMVAMTKQFQYLSDLLRDDVQLKNPAGWSPIQGKDAVRAALVDVLSIINPMHYERIWEGEKEYALEFVGKVGEVDVKGIDLMTIDDDGQITCIEVLIRPMSALMAIRETLLAKRAAAA
jgi:hypothetical protein